MERLIRPHVTAIILFKKFRYSLRPFPHPIKIAYRKRKHANCLAALAR